MILHGDKMTRIENVPYYLSVDCAGDTVLEFQVHLGDGVFGKDGCIGDITCTQYLIISSNSWTPS